MPKFRRKIALNVLLVLVFMLLLISFLFGYSRCYNNIIAGFALFFSVYAMYIYRKNSALFLTLFFIAYTNYSIVVGVYWDESLRFPYFDQISSISTYGIGIMCVMLFSFCICYFSMFIKDYSRGRFSITAADKHIQGNILISAICVLVYIFCFVYGLIYATSSIDGRIGNSAIKEYRIIFLVISLVYSKHINLVKKIWFIVLTVTTLIVMFGGSRADALGPLMCFFVYYYSDSTTDRQITLMLIPTIIIMAAVGYFRTNFTFSMESFVYTIDKLASDKLTYEGAIAAYFPSLAMIEVSHMLGFGEKILLFGRHLIYILLGSKIGDPNLAFFTRVYFQHFNGFISPSYFYVWTGMMSPVLLALIVFIYVRMLYTIGNPSMQKYCLQRRNLAVALYFLTTVFRWYEYGPMGLLRGVFVFAVIYFLIFLFDSLLRGCASFKRRTRFDNRI